MRLSSAESLAKTAVDGQHGDAVDGGPDEERHLLRVVAASQVLLLQRGERIDEHLKRTSAFPRQLRVGILHVRAILEMSAPNITR